MLKGRKFIIIERKLRFILKEIEAFGLQIS